MGLYENEMKSTPRLRNPYYIPETPDTEAMESYFIFDNPYKSISKLSNTSSIKKKRRKLPEKHIFATLISCIKNPGRESKVVIIFSRSQYLFKFGSTAPFASSLLHQVGAVSLQERSKMVELPFNVI